MQAPISGATRLAAVIGSPVGHSLSPALHNAAFAASGLDWRFVAFDVAAGRGGEAIAAMRTLGLGGLAVTMPHKADVATAVDELDPTAATLASVNTVVLREDGSTYGTSTDGLGFVDSLDAAGVPVSGARFLVLGAGGAGRAIIAALGREGVADIAVVNRTASAAEAAAALTAVARVGSLDDLARAEVLVNTTSIGMGSDECPIDPSALHGGLAVADIVYHPLETALLRAARDRGATTVDGLGMLVHQAVRQQELWTGTMPDAAAMRAAAERELRDRV